MNNGHLTTATSACLDYMEDSNRGQHISEKKVPRTLFPITKFKEPIPRRVSASSSTSSWSRLATYDRVKKKKLE